MIFRWITTTTSNSLHCTRLTPVTNNNWKRCRTVEQKQKKNKQQQRWRRRHNPIQQKAEKSCKTFYHAPAYVPDGAQSLFVISALWRGVARSRKHDTWHRHSWRTEERKKLARWKTKEMTEKICTLLGINLIMNILLLKLPFHRWRAHFCSIQPMKLFTFLCYARAVVVVKLFLFLFFSIL